MVRVSPPQKKALRSLARKQKVSESQLIRSVLEVQLGKA
jgi:predicted HicB family RNase H-like nuclease